MSTLDFFGWISSGLVIWSLMQARVFRFRTLNLVGAAMATVVNALLGIWPFAAMNGVIAVIDVYWIVRLMRERHDADVYEVIEVGIQDAYLAHLMEVNRTDLQATHPDFHMPEGPVPGEERAAAPAGGAAVGVAAALGAEGRSAFLVLRGSEAVGMVIVRDVGAGVGEVEVDYVTQRFRDFTPGEFVYRRSGIFAAKGFERLIVADVEGSRDYFARVGFRRVDGHWDRRVEPTGAA